MRWCAEDLGWALRWRHGSLSIAQHSLTTFPLAASWVVPELRSEGNT